MSQQLVLANLASGEIKTEYGSFQIAAFHDGLEEAVTVWKGRVEDQPSVLRKIHFGCLASHVFSGTECDCSHRMKEAQRQISQAGKGIIIYLSQEGRGNGVAAHIAAQSFRKRGLAWPDAHLAAGFPEDKRNYNAAAKVIKWFQIRSVTAMTTDRAQIEALRSLGITVEEEPRQGS